MATTVGRMVLLAGAALLLAGAADLAGSFECPEKGGRAWREVRTAHFAVQTDLGSSAATELAEDLERIHETVRFALFRKPPETGVLPVLAPRDRDEFLLFAPHEKFGAFYSRRSLAGPIIVIPGDIRDAQRAIAAHEITHHLAALAFARQPRWFSEGLACWMESVAQSGPRSTPTVGGVPAGRRRSVFPYHGGVVDVLDPKRWEPDARHYGTAWALVHFLVNQRASGFNDLQLRFARGQDPDAAWREVFPMWDRRDPKAMAALDDELGGYLARGKFAYRDVQLPPAPPVTERPLTAAEVHGTRLSLPWPNAGKGVDKALVRAEVQEALEHDPASVSGLMVLASLEKSRAGELAKRAVQGHPEDARAWLLLVPFIPASEAALRLEVLERAVEADPASASALNDLAWELLGKGRAAEALPIANRAVGLSPGTSAILDTQAGVLEALGQCAEALRAQHRAIDVLPEGTAEAGRAPYLERVNRLEKSCGAPGEAPPAPAAAPTTAG